MRIPDAASCAAGKLPTDRGDKAGWTGPRSKGRIVFVPIGSQKKECEKSTSQTLVRLRAMRGFGAVAPVPLTMLAQRLIMMLAACTFQVREVQF